MKTSIDPTPLLPPDWKEDKKLWEILGKIPKGNPGSNFVYMVRQKLARKMPIPSVRLSWFTSHLPSFTLPRRWLGGFAIVAVCLMLLAVWSKWPCYEPKVLEVSSSVFEKNELKDSTQLVQNHEWVQDFEVIEHLDEL